MVQVLFKHPDVGKYMENLIEQKAKDESEKRKLERRREKELIGTDGLIEGEDNNYQSDDSSGDEDAEEEAMNEVDYSLRDFF